MNPDRLDWDETFMTLALTFALRSPDPSSKCGAVIVDRDRTVISSGYNGFPRGYRNDIKDWTDRERKYELVIHSEANAILNAGRQGKQLLGSAIYVTGPPCSNCAKMIVQSGIQEVVYIQDEAFLDRWGQSFELTKEIFRACNVSLREMDFSPPTIQRFTSGVVSYP